MNDERLDKIINRTVVRDKILSESLRKGRELDDKETELFDHNKKLINQKPIPVY
jgi:hypothetical protein